MNRQGGGQKSTPSATTATTRPPVPAISTPRPSEPIVATDRSAQYSNLVRPPVRAAARPRTNTIVRNARPPNNALSSSTATGEKVEIFWGNKWWPGVVVKREGQRAFVHYDGWSDSFNEWVTPDRVRPGK
jgi:hypothetical protein